MTNIGKFRLDEEFCLYLQWLGLGSVPVHTAGLVYTMLFKLTSDLNMHECVLKIYLAHPYKKIWNI